MKIYTSPVTGTKKIQENVYLISIKSPELAAESKPGQFCNIKVSDTNFPLLRRPFSICDVEGEKVSFMFNVAGEGTKILACKKEGDLLNILGPLGTGFKIDPNLDNAVIAAGGLGSAPFALLTKHLGNKNITSFIGGRTEKDVIDYGMKNCQFATDDGSRGFKGNIVQLIETQIEDIKKKGAVIFACGPTPMLKALQDLSLKNNIECQLSTECAMACGFGICQGCNVESTVHEDKYCLVCIDGPVFNARDIKL